MLLLLPLVPVDGFVASPTRTDLGDKRKDLEFSGY
jgi:hypothetical protein